jgi:galactokinase
MPGVYGSRMTGGGFGGCTISLVRASGAEEFRRSIVGQYRGATGLTPDVYVFRASNGVEEVFA